LISDLYVLSLFYIKFKTQINYNTYFYKFIIIFIILLGTPPSPLTEVSYFPSNEFPNYLFYKFGLNNQFHSCYYTRLENYNEYEGYKVHHQNSDHRMIYIKLRGRLKVMGRFPFLCKRIEMIFNLHLYRQSQCH